MRGFKISGLKRCLGCALTCMLFLFSAAPLHATDEAPRHGLIWNKTGLPAVFPLQVRSNAGTDYHMVLTDADTGTPALAGYIEGGQFFKVLVPPGLYTVRFATGHIWRGEQQLFGADETRMINVPSPLRFGVVGLSTKAGHVLDIREPDTGVLVQDSFDCRRIRLTKGPRPLPAYDPDAARVAEIKPEQDLIEYPYRSGPLRGADRQDTPPIATDYAPYFSRPEYEVRRSPC